MQRFSNTLKYLFFLLGFYFCGLYAQKNEPIEIINSDVFEFATMDNQPIRKLIGNVVLKQKSTFMYCDSAYHFTHENSIQAFSNVKMIMDDTTQLKGEKLFYDGNTQIAEVFYNVQLTDNKTTLFTDYLLYNRKTQIGEYNQKGKLKDSENELVSVIGQYNTQTKNALFMKDIKLTNKDIFAWTDTLEYNTQSKMVTLKAPTHVLGLKDSSKAYSERGFLDTEKKNFYLYQNPWYQDSNYFAKADTLYFWDDQDSGKAICNVYIQNRDTSTILYGDFATWNSKNHQFWLTHDPYVIYFYSNDTMTLFADTLFSVQDTSKRKKELIAWKNVKLITNSFQAICDSLHYNQLDSIISFIQNPIIWSDSSQMMGDTVYLWLKNNNPDSIAIRKNSFLISQQDSVGFNQIKGLHIDGKFKDKEIHWMLVQKEANSIYFAKDGDEYLGMNQGKSENIEIWFEENKPSKIIFHKNAESTYFPMHEIWFEKNQLEGFQWLIDKKPQKYWYYSTESSENQKTK